MIEPSSSPSSKKMKACIEGANIHALLIDFTKKEEETAVVHEWKEVQQPNYEALVIIWLFELRDFPSKFVLGDAET